MISPEVRMLYHHMFDRESFVFKIINDQEATDIFWKTEVAREMCMWHTKNGIQNYVDHILGVPKI